MPLQYSSSSELVKLMITQRSEQDNEYVIWSEWLGELVEFLWALHELMHTYMYTWVENTFTWPVAGMVNSLLVFLQLMFNQINLLLHSPISSITKKNSCACTSDDPLPRSSNLCHMELHTTSKSEGLCSSKWTMLDSQHQDFIIYTVTSHIQSGPFCLLSKFSLNL